MPDLTGRYSVREQIECIERLLEECRRAGSSEVPCLEQIRRTLQALISEPGRLTPAAIVPRS